MFAIATEDNTLVQVTFPAGIATQTHAAGSTFTQLLIRDSAYKLISKPASESIVYNYSGGAKTMYLGDDLTGTKIESVSSGTGGCKPIAVFSGVARLPLYAQDFYLTEVILQGIICTNRCFHKPHGAEGISLFQQ